MPTVFSSLAPWNGGLPFSGGPRAQGRLLAWSLFLFGFPVHPLWQRQSKHKQAAVLVILTPLKILLLKNKKLKKTSTHLCD